LNAIPTNIQPPHDPDVERGVLGACMAWPDLLEPVLSACCPDDFYDATNAAIAGAIVAINAESVPVTPLTVATKLPNARAGAGMSIREYLDAITETAPALGVVALARSIADMRLRREGIAAAQDVIEGLSMPALGVLEAVRPLQEVSERAAAMIGKRQMVPVREAADAMLRTASDRAAGRAVVAATTGISLLDEAIGGLQGGNLIVYAGRPGMGKTALLMTTALRAALQGRPAIVFSLEMTQESLLQRLGTDLAFDANSAHPLSYSWFYNGSARHEDIALMGEALKRLPENLYVFRPRTSQHPRDCRPGPCASRQEQCHGRGDYRLSPESERQRPLQGQQGSRGHGDFGGGQGPSHAAEVACGGWCPAQPGCGSPGRKAADAF
jgi:hypothetical protein